MLLSERLNDSCCDDSDLCEGIVSLYRSDVHDVHDVCISSLIILTARCNSKSNQAMLRNTKHCQVLHCLGGIHDPQVDGTANS